MGKGITFVGLDVHKDSITVAVAEEDDACRGLGTIPNQEDAVARLVRKIGPVSRLRVCYEAGPCGYGLYRELQAIGVQCQVVAPTLIPVRPGERVKTDRRDAEKLARLLRSGDLTAVWVPDAGHEALRDLVRAREAVKQDLLRARHRLTKLLLRLGQRYPRGGKSWSQRHMAWLRALVLPQPGQQAVKIDYLAEVEHQLERVARLDAELATVVAAAPRAVRRIIEGLQVLHGVAQITAVTAVAEIGEFTRFAKPRELMAYGGIVPREHSSGGSIRRGAITKTGNARLRRVLIEAAWHYRHAPTPSWTVRQRRRGQPGAICRIADKAQQRLHLRYRRLLGRGKSKQIVVTALGRELLGFMWAIAVELERQPLAPAAA